MPNTRVPGFSNHHLLNNLLHNYRCCRRNIAFAHSEAITSLVPHGSCHELAQTVCTGSVSLFSWKLQTWLESHCLDEQHTSLLSDKPSHFPPDPSLQGHLPRRKELYINEINLSSVSTYILGTNHTERFAERIFFLFFIVPTTILRWKYQIFFSWEYPTPTRTPPTNDSSKRSDTLSRSSSM